MVQCFAPNCNHNNQNNSCQFRRFPHSTKSPHRRRKWKELTRRLKSSPGKTGRLCSCHFENKDANIPTIFEWNSAKRKLHYPSPEKRRRRQSPKPALHNDLQHECVPVQDDENTGGQDDGNTGGKDDEITTEEDDGITTEEDTEVAKLQKLIVSLKSENSSLKEKLDSSTKELHKEKSDNLVKSSQIYFLEKSVGDKQRNSRFTLDSVADQISHYTGLPNVETFNLLFSIFEDEEILYYLGWAVQCISRKDQLLMTLMKLRRNYSNIDLAQRFGVSVATVSNIFLTWIHVLYEFLVEGVMAKMPSRSKNKASMPKAFSTYGSCRVIIDCTEVFAAVPRKMSDQNAMYSDYKHRITLKGLVGVAPNGSVIFISKLYPGSLSDKEIVRVSGVLDQLKQGDFVMADKGFLISDLLPAGVTLNIPPFRCTPQFTPSQVAETLSIAQARIHVERAIRVGKTYHILDFIPGKYVSFASTIFQVCFALTNFKTPLIGEVKEGMFKN